MLSTEGKLAGIGGGAALMLLSLSCVSKEQLLRPGPGYIEKYQKTVSSPDTLKGLPQGTVLVAVTITPKNPKFTSADVVTELNKVLSLSGRTARVAGNGQKPAFSIDLKTEAKSEQYRVFGSGPPRTLYAGAVLQIDVKAATGASRSLHCTKKPDYGVTGNKYRTPEEAPYAETLHAEGCLTALTLSGLIQTDGLPLGEKLLRGADTQVHALVTQFVASAKPAGGAALLARSLAFEHTEKTCAENVWALYAMGAREELGSLVRAAVERKHCAAEVIRVAGMWNDRAAVLAASLLFKDPANSVGARRQIRDAGYYYGFAAGGMKDKRLVPAFGIYVHEMARMMESETPSGPDMKGIENAIEIMEEATGQDHKDAGGWAKWWRQSRAAYPFGDLEAMLAGAGSRQ